MLVANHAGPLPWDAALISAALRARRVTRGARGCSSPTAPSSCRGCRSPRGASAVSRDTPENAERLLAGRASGLRVPRGGARRAQALRTPLPPRGLRPGRVRGDRAAHRRAIVPTAVVGSEEAYPRLGAVPVVGRALGGLSLPRRLPNPLAAVPLPVRWRIDFGAPVAVSGHAGRAAADRTARAGAVRRGARPAPAGDLRHAGQARGGLLMATAEFGSPEEFREVVDRTFAMMDERPAHGPEPARRRGAAALRLRRPRPRREHPRRA